MGNQESMPTEREWLLMEAIWEAAELKTGITSAEILKKVQSVSDMTDRTERVLLHHLCKKGLVGYTADAQDSRVYHYFAKVSRAECLAKKERDFIDTYYQGNASGALASFIGSMELTDEQIRELEELLTKKGKKHVR